MDLTAALDEAYRIILGREPDDEGKAYYARRLVEGSIDLAGVCSELARSPEFLARLKRPPPPAAPPPHAIDVRDLLARLSVEDLARSADEYFRGMGNPDYCLAKPLANVDEAPDHLVCFGTLLGGLRPLPGMTVLDFGAGTCWTSRWLTQLGCAVVAWTSRRRPWSWAGSCTSACRWWGTSRRPASCCSTAAASTCPTPASTASAASTPSTTSPTRAMSSASWPGSCGTAGWQASPSPAPTTQPPPSPSSR